MGKKGRKLPPGDPSAIGKQIGILRHVNSDVKFDGNTQFWYVLAFEQFREFHGTKEDKKGKSCSSPPRW